MSKVENFIDRIIYWSIIILPFTIAINQAPISIFMGFLIAGLTAKQFIKKDFRLLKNSLFIPLSIFFGVTCLSILNSINYADTLKGGMLKLFMYIFVLSAIASQVRERQQIKNIIISISCGIIFIFADSLVQLSTGKDFVKGYMPMLSLDLTRVTASFKDPNTMGIYLSAILPLVFGLVIYQLKGLKKIVLSIVCLAGLLAALLTYSRPTLLAIYVALFILGTAKKNKVLIGFLIILPLAGVFFMPKSVKEWAKTVEYNPIRFMANDDRIAVWRNSINMIKDHPVIGVGANTYMKNYKKYKESPEYRNAVTSDYMYAHNNFLQMAGEIGILGLGAFLWLLYCLFNACIDIYRKLTDKFIKIISLSLIACLAAFLTNGLTESSLYSSRVALIFWYLAGLALALNNFTHETK